jgi:hypothetical protein
MGAATTGAAPVLRHNRHLNPISKLKVCRMDRAPFLSPEWNRYRRHCHLFLVVAFSWVPLGWVLPEFFPGGLSAIGEVLFGIYAIVWFVTCLYLMLRLTLFMCPRCDKPYFVTWLYGNPFAGNCLHCKLPKWERGKPLPHNG